MKLLRTLFDWFSSSPRRTPSGRKSKHLGHLEQAMVRLVANGEITLAEVKGNHPTNVVMRLRKKGLLKPCGAAGGEAWRTNPKTGCDYKVYFWTGKLPDNWVKSAGYTGRDRRKAVRGCQVERRGCR